MLIGCEVMRLGGSGAVGMGQVGRCARVWDRRDRCVWDEVDETSSCDRKACGNSIQSVNDSSMNGTELDIQSCKYARFRIFPKTHFQKIFCSVCSAM